MKLPKDWKPYRASVRDKIGILCQSGLWGVNKNKIFAWLNNFKHDEHKYLAIHILDSIIYRSKEMTRSAYQRFIWSTLKHSLEDEHERPLMNLDDWDKELLGRYSILAKELILSPIKLEGHSGDSGEIIVRTLTSDIMGQHLVNVINERSWRSLENKTILLVDDFLGTGDQFSQFYDETNMKEVVKTNRVIYAPSMARQDAVKTLRGKNLGIEIMPVELLADEESIFFGSETDLFRHDSINTIADALNCYEDIRTTYGLYESTWQGYDNLGLSVVFETGCPNHTLGILYQHKDKSSPWEQLFKRRQ